ncbi:MAG: prepilin-type N-terminal cleavage/methylation domain-containing protein [Planctomycetota bacterium]|nr:prepilin-type N-terminal cleavage/methylation domain-containing protein [Planctomycetota bacterium]
MHANAPLHARRGLSLIEMMIALAISATLLTATLTALDAMFKGYKQTTESASTHVVSRIVMARLTGMIRTGSGFGPIPADIFDRAENPIASDFIEFVSARDADENPTEMIRIEYRVPVGFAAINPGWDDELRRTWGARGGPPDDLWPPVAGELWFVRLDLTEDPPEVIQENPLLTGVRSVVFTSHYLRGPKLTRTTIDITVEPNDSEDLALSTDMEVQTFRLVASAAPRSEQDKAAAASAPMP